MYKQMKRGIKMKFFVGQKVVDGKGNKYMVVENNRAGNYPVTVITEVTSEHPPSVIGFTEEALSAEKEYKFHEVIAGLEQGHFQFGDKFMVDGATFIVKRDKTEALCLKGGLSGKKVVISSWAMAHPWKQM